MATIPNQTQGRTQSQPHANDFQTAPPFTSRAPGLAFDRHALQLQVGDIAVDRALRDLEPMRQEGGRGEPAPANELDDLEQDTQPEALVEEMQQRQHAAAAQRPKQQPPHPAPQSGVQR